MVISSAAPTASRPPSLGELIRATHGVVSLPEVYYRAQELLDDPRHDLGSLAKTIETDAGLAARLLRVVNSPLYGLPRRVDRISYALSILGNDHLRDLLLATSVTRIFTKIPARLVDLSTFWHHSIYCGLIAQRLARRCRVLHAERLMVAGIVHDIGQLVLYQVQPERSAQVLALAEPIDDGMHRAELAVFGYSHGEVGAALLQTWRMPDSLGTIVRHHHQPRQAGPFRLEAAIVHIANSLANRMEPGRNIPLCQPVIDPEAWDITGLDESSVNALLNETTQDFIGVLELLLPRQARG